MSHRSSKEFQPQNHFGKEKQISKTAWNKEMVDGGKRKKRQAWCNCIEVLGGDWYFWMSLTILCKRELYAKSVHLTKNFTRLVSRQGQFASQVIWTLIGQMMELIGGEKEFCPHCCFDSAILKLTRLSNHKFVYTAESTFLLV